MPLANRYERLLELVKPAYASHLLLPRNLVLTIFSEFVMAFSAKLSLLFLLYLMVLRFLSLASDKANLFKDIFSDSSNIDGSVVSETSSPVA